MSRRYKSLVILILMVVALFLPTKASATVPVSTGYKGPNQAVIIAMRYEDASAIRHVQAKLEQDLAALEHAFVKLQNDGVLDPAFPRLVINATKFYKVDYRFERAPTVLSKTNSAYLVCNLQEGQQFDPVALGPAYVINTSTGLLNYADLAAMMVLLSGLNDTTSAIRIGSEEKLLAARADPVFKEIMNLRLKKDESTNVSGNFRVSTLWSAGKTFYSLIDGEGNNIADLKSADIYICRPSWPPAERTDLQGRLIAYAAKDEAIIYDIVQDKYHTLSLGFDYNVQRVGFALHATENKVYMLPYGIMGSISIAYSLNLDTGKWLRELENFLISDEVRSNREKGVWLDFLPATEDSFMQNIYILTDAGAFEEWRKREELSAADMEGEQAISGEQPAEVLPEGEGTPAEQPPLEEIYVNKEGKVSELPGRLAGISLFNVIVAVLLLLMAAGITGLSLFVKRKFSRQAPAPISKSGKRL